MISASDTYKHSIETAIMVYSIERAEVVRRECRKTGQMNISPLSVHGVSTPDVAVI